MKLAKYRGTNGKDSIGLVEEDRILPLESSGNQYQTLSDLFEAEDRAGALSFMINRSVESLPLSTVQLLPPVDRQEVWAAGVTYRRSKTARMEESATAASVYDMVYEAARPELFFKATAARVVGPSKAVRIRRDSKWNVPEPELALVLNSRLELVGYTIGNDMSSRDIEGENPLYLPQAKLYDQSCALGPWITLAHDMPPRKSIGIALSIARGEEVVFEGQTNVGQMARKFEELIEYLGRDNTFRDGAVLLTGTGIVPDASFTLEPGDAVSISIDGIGTLSNSVVQA
jgi:2-dehydro-3-deoxy-D-arabinonate dehydratase